MIRTVNTCLDLSENLIAETGAVSLGRALAINNSLEDLNLSRNCIRQRGAVAICKGLQDNGCLSRLDVSCNGFGYEGSLAVGELLKANSTLTELDLSANRIDWLAIPLIASGLANNTTLQILTEVPVISDFELVTMMITHSRPKLSCQHGGVINSPDIVGQRSEKRVAPIENVRGFSGKYEERLQCVIS